jgi:hypothetical protein
MNVYSLLASVCSFVSDMVILIELAGAGLIDGIMV